MAPVEVGGVFWLAGGAGPRRSGVLRLEKEASPLLEVQGPLTPSMRLIATHQPPEGEGEGYLEYGPVLDLSPTTIHGEDTAGSPLTLLEALSRSHNGGFTADSQVQELVAVYAVLGGHLVGRDHKFSGARVRLRTVGGLLSIEQEAAWGAATPLVGGGSIKLSEEISGTWVVFQDLPAVSLRGLDRGILRTLSSLLGLAVGEPVGLLDLEVQEDLQGPWSPVHSQAHRASDLPVRRHALLHGRDLPPAAVATWLARADTLGPLPPVVASALRGTVPLESRVLELSTVAEGLHRRLRPDARRFPEERAEQIRAAAAAAAGYIDPGSEEVVKGFLAFLHEPGYGQRLRDLAEMGEAAAPGVTGRTPCWKEAVYGARNDFAHRTDRGWLDDADVDRYPTVALSLQWLLRAVLLGQADIPNEVLADRFRAHDSYRLFLEQAEVWQPNIYGTPQSSA